MNEKFKSLAKLNLGKVLTKSEAKNAIGGYGELLYLPPGMLHCEFDEKTNYIFVITWYSTTKYAGSYDGWVDHCPTNPKSFCLNYKGYASRTSPWTDIIVRAASCG